MVSEIDYEEYTLLGKGQQFKVVGCNIPVFVLNSFRLVSAL